MSQDDPLDVNILELFRSNFSSEGTEGMHGAVLGGHIDVGLFLGEQDCDQVKINWGNDDI